MKIRKIHNQDNKAVAEIIRDVMTEFGANGEGFSIHDAEVQSMYEHYTIPRSKYFVVELDGKVMGGGGIAPLEGADASICELKKMYFRPQIRGKGAGKMIMQKCLEAARKFGYKKCYIETIARMETANKLYTANGFKKIENPLGATGHHGCESFYTLDL